MTRNLPRSNASCYGMNEPNSTSVYGFVHLPSSKLNTALQLYSVAPYSCFCVEKIENNNEGFWMSIPWLSNASIENNGHANRLLRLDYTLQPHLNSQTHTPSTHNHSWLEGWLTGGEISH